MPPVPVIRSTIFVLALAALAPSCAESDLEQRDAAASAPDDDAVDDDERDDEGAAGKRDAATSGPRDATLGGADRDASAPSDASAAPTPDASGTKPVDAGATVRDAGPVDASAPRDAALTDARVGDGGDASAVEPGTCPSAQVGWSTVAGDGVSATTGGGNVAPVRPKTADELLRYASDAEPRVIEIAGSFDVPRLSVASNKTLIGIGPDATLRGGVRIRGSEKAPVSNVIVRNLRVDGATTQVDADAMQLYFAHHVWIDHCEIWDGPDGNLDMTHAVNWVTVSFTKIRYTERYQKPSGESKDHRYAVLIGHSDSNESEDTGRLKVTFHHNFWGERVIERMPRVRFGQVHVFNDYFAAPGNNYCVRAGRGAQLLIENSYFDHVGSPHEFNSSEDQATAHVTVRGNVYDGTTGTQATGGGGKPFTSVPYAVTLDAPERVPALVRSCAGPR